MVMIICPDWLPELPPFQRGFSERQNWGHVGGDRRQSQVQAEDVPMLVDQMTDLVMLSSDFVWFWSKGGLASVKSQTCQVLFFTNFTIPGIVSTVTVRTQHKHHIRGGK